MNILISQTNKNIISNPIKIMIDVTFGKNKNIVENTLQKSITQIKYFLSLDKEIFEEIFEADNKKLKVFKKKLENMNCGKILLKYAEKFTKSQEEYKTFFEYANLFYDKIKSYISLIDEYLAPMVDEDSPEFKKFLIETANEIIEKKERKLFNNLDEVFYALQN